MDFVARHWGDLASLLGLTYTIWLAYRAKTAAEQARDAARAARDRLFSLDTIKELTTAKMALNEIIRLQRLNVWGVGWDVVLDRYESARLSLVRCEHAPGVPQAQRDAIRLAVVRLRIIVVKIETARIHQDQTQLDIVTINRFLSTQIDALERARIAIERSET